MAIEIVAVLDRSGSMGGDETKVIDAFNEFISKHKDSHYKCNVSLILFDDRIEEVYYSIPIEEVKPLTRKTYYVRGMTALNDAVGETINNFQFKDKVFFFVETDGMENSSKEYNTKEIKALIEEKQKKGWEFVFVGADLTQQQTHDMSSSFGININNTINVAKTQEGYGTRNTFLSDTLSSYASKVENK